MSKDQEKLLADKQRELEENLDQWARKVLHLKAHERIVVTLEVEDYGIPKYVRDLFTSKLCAKFGLYSAVGQRRLCDRLGNLSLQSLELMTESEVLDLVTDKSKVVVVKGVLDHYGRRLRE